MVLKIILHTPGGKMRFLKTFFRFCTITILCTTFTTVAWGADCDYSASRNCNDASGCYNEDGGDLKKYCFECPAGYICPRDRVNKKSPTACNNGKYQDEMGQVSCKTCPAGKMTPNDTNAYTSCTTCIAGTYSAAGASSCSNCAPGSYSGAGASSCTKCPVGFYQSAGGQKDCDKCPDGTTTSGEGKTGPNDCKKKFNLALYVEYQQGGNTGIYSVSTATIAYYEGTTAVHSITTMKHQLAYKISDLKNKYTAPTETNQAYISINGTKYYLTSNGDNWQSTSTLTNALASQAHDSTFNLVFILQPKPYNVYMISDGYNNGSPSPMFNANTTAVATKKFGDTPSTGVTPDKNKVATCSFGTGTTTYYGYIADDTAPKYYECKKNSTYFNLISNSSNGSTNMFEPSQDGNDICIGYSMTTCEAGYSCNSCKRSACGSGKYQDKPGQSSCKSCSEQTSSEYPNSAEGSNNINSCYLTTTAGKYVKTTGAGEVDCACGGYCPGNTTVYYSSGHGSTTGGRSTCGAGKYNGKTGSKAETDCLTTNAGYYATAGSCSQTTVNAGCYGAAGSTNACPNNCPADTSGRTVSSNAGSSKAKDCYATCTDKTISNGTATKRSLSKLYDGTTYPACTYDTNCDAGYYGADNVTDPSCASCPDGQYSAANALSCSSCGDGKISNSDKTGCDSCLAGTYSTDSMTTCQPCPSGTYQNNTEQKTCISCQDGKTSTTSTPTGIFTTSGTGKTSRTECCLKSGIVLQDSIATSGALSLSNVCWKK